MKNSTLFLWHSHKFLQSFHDTLLGFTVVGKAQPEHEFSHQVIHEARIGNPFGAGIFEFRIVAGKNASIIHILDIAVNSSVRIVLLLDADTLVVGVLLASD